MTKEFNRSYDKNAPYDGDENVSWPQRPVAKADKAGNRMARSTPRGVKAAAVLALAGIAAGGSYGAVKAMNGDNFMRPGHYVEAPRQPQPPVGPSTTQPEAHDTYAFEEGNNPWNEVHHHLVDDAGQPVQDTTDNSMVNYIAAQKEPDGNIGVGRVVNLPAHTHHTPIDTNPPVAPTSQIQG